MPKASKIKIIDIVEDEQPNVEAGEAVVPVVAVETAEPVVMKTKPKPRAKAKPKPEAVLEPVVEEPVAEEVVEEKIKPKLELFPCPRCGKELTQKGLKYSHKCPADKVIKQPEPEQPVAVVAPVRVSRPRAPRAKPEKEPISEELIQDEIRRRMEHAKVARRDRHQDNIKRLAVNIV